MEPKIAILLATYNRSHFIGETLDSIMNQTYKNWECIIVDDHSKDYTKELVSFYLEKDQRFSYFKKTNYYKPGLSGTRNFGLDLAETIEAEFVQFFDDDDIMHSRKLELQIIPFESKPKLNFTVSKFEKLILQENDYRIHSPIINLSCSHLGDAMLTGELRINSLGPLWRMEFINQFRFDETLSYAEEWELYTRIGYQYPGNYEVVDEYLFQYRKHPESLTMGKDETYERRKTSAIIRIKIFEFLSDNKLHTHKSILFLSKNFLIETYRPEYIQQLLEYIKNEKHFTNKLSLFLKFALLLSSLYRKIITGMASWIS